MSAALSALRQRRRNDRLRQRRHRERVAFGKAVLAVEVVEEEVVEALLIGGLLDAREVEDRDAIEAALAEQIRVLTWLALNSPHHLLGLRILAELLDDGTS
jgi:hypothetical protein